MAVKVADTLRPNNSGDEPVKGGFPTALACDVWLSDGRSVEEAIEGTSGASIQVAEIPEPSEAQFGKIYQYIGETTEDYISGYFYECIIDGAAYKWVEKTVQKSNADISEEADNVLEQKTDGLYVRKTTAIIYTDTLPEYGTIDDYIYRIQNNQYKELVIDGSIMNGNDPQAAVDHITSKGFVVNDPDEPDHEGYYEAVFKFRDIEYHDELTDQYPMIAKFYIRKSASIVGDKFIAKTTTDGETYTELAFSSEDMIPLRYKEETMYLGDKKSQSLARMVLYSDLDTLDIDAVIYDTDLPIPADRKNKVYCTTYTNNSLVFDTTKDHYLYDIVDYARKNNFTFEYSTEYYVIVQTSSKEVYQSSDRSKRVGRIDVYIGSNNVTLTVYDTTNTVIKSEEAASITLDLITETLTPYLCQIDSATSFKLLSYDEFKSSILPRVIKVPENAASGFYQEDLYTNVVIKWTSIESVIESLESSGFVVTAKESDPSEYWIDFPNNYSLLRISHPSLEEHLTTKDLCERMDLKMSGSYPTIGVYCNGVLKISFSGSNFRYATEQDSDDKNGTKLIAVNNNGDKTRLALYSDILRNITQAVILPTPSKENLGKVYQYIGVSGTYTNGCFYKCVASGSSYAWVMVDVVKNPVSYMGTPPNYSGDGVADGKVIVYSGEDANGFLKGHHYRWSENFTAEVHEIKCWNESHSSYVSLYIADDVVNVGTRLYTRNGDTYWCQAGVVSNDGDTLTIYSVAEGTFTAYGYEIVEDSAVVTIEYSWEDIDTADGITYTPSIGEVTTVDSTESASASVSVNAETKEAVFNFAIPRGNKGIDGVQISDNETVEDKTWSSSKIASEIPTTLPANGGNADTVNNHTVKSDVPENAVFTDTVYNDTGIKAEIANNGTPVGCIFPFAGINLPAGYLPCNGASYKKTDYPDLYAVIGNTYGGDTVNFKVPNLVGKFIEGSTTSGTAKAAGLPNITGETRYISEGCIWSGTPGGAFNGYAANTSIQINNVALSSKKHYGYYFIFDASRSNAIYGKSNTVQPPALTMVYIIKARYIYE